MLLVCLTGRSQEISHQYSFHSQIIADSTGVGVPNCHIINKTQRIGTVGDQNGFFRITAEIGDSLTFSSIGFEKLSMAVADSMYTNDRVIRLKHTTYTLSEAEVIKVNFDIPVPSRYEISRSPLPNQGGFNLLPTEISPISFFYKRFSKEEKRKRHYRKITEGSDDQSIIMEKYNGTIVSRLTGLEDEELIEFMSYCAFSKEFLRNMSSETIRRNILKKFEEYKNR
ncbi:MAG: hypothetical protein LBQ60_21635 [Bacteroidales bacterium]|jgi:hypothetical protein|nr:hypothetical protein [Bacteroidales bacterium]